MVTPEKPILPPLPSETAYEAAKMAYVGWAINQVPNLTLGSGTDVSQGEHYLAERFRPGDSLNDEGYEDLVLTALREMLPQVKKLPKPRPLKQSETLADFIEENDFLITVHHLPHETPNNTYDKKVALRAAATAAGLGRTALAVHPYKGSKRLVWPAGVRGAASLFRASIHKEADRLIYRDEEQILRLVDTHLRNVKPREVEDRQGTSWDYFFALNTHKRDKIRLIRDEGTPHGLFWRQLRRDLARLKRSASRAT